MIHILMDILGIPHHRFGQDYVGIPATDTSIIPYTGFVTELLETYATEAKANYAMKSKYEFSLKRTGTKPKRHSCRVSNCNCTFAYGLCRTALY
jgi:hypothetical protein